MNLAGTPPGPGLRTSVAQILPFHFGLNTSVYDLNSAASTSLVFRKITELTAPSNARVVRGSAASAHQRRLLNHADSSSISGSISAGLSGARAPAGLSDVSEGPVPLVKTSARNFPADRSVVRRETCSETSAKVPCTFMLGKAFSKPSSRAAR